MENKKEFDENMRAYCGAYCGTCEWREKTGCKGCKAQGGKMFWGECDKAVCCIGKGFEHCGSCPELPCRKLEELFSDPEHGDDGARLKNLEGWANGVRDYNVLINKSQDKAKDGE